jgi:hypothetical protein
VAITIQVHSAQYDVQELKARDAENKPLIVRVLILKDPVTGIPIHFPFPEAEAEKLAKLLQGEKAADLVVASPGDIPKHPEDRDGAS